MKTKSFFPILLIALFLTNCAQFQFQPKITSAASEAVRKAQPKHVGDGQYGSYGLYDFTVYSHSVVIKATSAVVIITDVTVYDLNRDGSLDSIFVLEDGVWKFATYLGPRYRLIESTASKSLLDDYIGLGNHARRDIRIRNAAAARRQKEAQERTYLYYQDISSGNQ
jgi:hypothetical protein